MFTFFDEKVNQLSLLLARRHLSVEDGAFACTLCTTVRRVPRKFHLPSMSPLRHTPFSMGFDGARTKYGANRHFFFVSTRKLALLVRSGHRLAIGATMEQSMIPSLLGYSSAKNQMCPYANTYFPRAPAKPCGCNTLSRVDHARLRSKTGLQAVSSVVATKESHPQHHIDLHS